MIYAALREEYHARCVDTTSDIYEHLPLFYSTALKYQQPRILELGVRWGNSSCAFLLGAHDAGGHLYSIDINPVPDMVPFKNDERWSFLRADDLSLDAEIWARDNIEFFLNGYDILFIDTSHYLAHTLAELNIYVPLVKKGGVVFMHDTEWEDREVAQALDVYTHINKKTWQNHKNCNGLGVMYV